MKFTVYYTGRNLDEIEVIKNFLRWQGATVEFIADKNKAFKLTEGRGFIAIMTTNAQVLAGFKDLIQHFDDGGLWQI